MLEKIEKRQLVQGIPIAISILVRSPISWSEDNKIAVITQLGTYVFELILCPEECSPAVMFSRSFIPPPSEPSPYSDTGIDVKNLVIHVERTSGHALMLDNILSSTQRIRAEQDPRNMRNTSPAMPGGDTNHLGYRRGEWSPCGVGLQGRCLLTLATHDQRVFIVGLNGRHWEILWDVSARWHQHVSFNNWAAVSSVPGASQLEKYTARMHMLATAEFQWTPVHEDEDGKCSMLIVMTVGGHAVFWRIPANFTGAEDVRIMAVKETDMHHISALHWCVVTDKTGYLTTGTTSGLVKIFYCQFKEDDVLLTDLGLVYDTKDRMHINHMRLSCVTSDQYLLLVAKHNMLLAFTLTLMPDHLAVNNTCFSYAGKLAISGFVLLKTKNVYMAVKDGTVQHVSLNISQDGSLSMEEHGAVFRSEGVSYNGLMTSPNKTLWGILESVSVAYDHLVVREPTQISIYQVDCSSKMYQYVLESEKALYTNADVLESLRILSCKEGWSPMTPVQVNEIPEFPLRLLKVHYWLTKIFRSTNITEHRTLELTNEVEHNLQTAILEHWIIDTLSRFITTDVSSQPLMLLSLSLMCEWIMKNGSENDKDMAEIFSSKLGHVKQEMCLVCHESVQLSFLTHGRCKNGHTLPRCCRSLLLTPPTLLCPNCRVFAHKDAVYFEFGEWLTCTYCDGFMVEELGRERQLRK
ncbi:general transcription factor 3C polypeptide 4 isoform X2 [Cherax quadricarinatus]|uniref:general transcription factor 3C polypeptide 4 isoform X2 n=1 Tax=Cherax quadricarinatus TaxID=27406 RepID=UPI00387ECBC4